MSEIVDSLRVLARRTLGALAEKCHAYAKALHYKELEFQNSPESCVEALISINNQLRQPEAAIGILTYAQQTLHLELKVGALADSRVTQNCAQIDRVSARQRDGPDVCLEIL